MSADYDRTRTGARAKKHAVTDYLPYIAYRLWKSAGMHARALISQ